MEPAKNNGEFQYTLFNLIAGLLQPSSGQIFVDGEEVAGTLIW